MQHSMEQGTGPPIPNQTNKILVGECTVECWTQQDSSYQLGGTSITIIHKLSHQAQWPGDDTVGLGHWCWT